MQQTIEAFLETWMEEFGRAVEMFTGSQPALSQNRISMLPASEPGSLLWRKQAFGGRADFVTWTGAAEAAWKDLGSADPDNAQGTYFEILNQAQMRAATVASRGLDQPISCGESAAMAEADFDATQFAIYRVAIDGGRIPDLFIAIELAAASVFEARAEAAAGLELIEQRHEGEPAPLVTERLFDLELPVAISLGYAEVPVKAIPAMTPGAVIELNKETGEDVELLVHGRVVARGEITLVKGNYGLRIKHIVGADDRLTLIRK
jgi:flagellar motor switch protein FliN/FliY